MARFILDLVIKTCAEMRICETAANKINQINAIEMSLKTFCRSFSDIIVHFKKFAVCNFK